LAVWTAILVRRTKFIVMKKLLASLAVLLALAGCSAHDGGSSSSDSNTLTVAATAIPHAEILKQIKPMLAKEGVDLRSRCLPITCSPTRRWPRKTST
jgi:hypothetical protein